jgi:hypothetical protein
VSREQVGVPAAVVLGLGFPNDNGQAVALRPSSGRVAVGPCWSHGIHEWTGTADPTRLGTVWAMTGYELLRTDGGTYNFSRTIADSPEALTDNTDQLPGIAVDADGVAWVGATALYDGPAPGGALTRIDADTGEYEIFRSSQGWPPAGDAVTPWAWRGVPKALEMEAWPCESVGPTARVWSS